MFAAEFCALDLLILRAVQTASREEASMFILLVISCDFKFKFLYILCSVCTVYPLLFPSPSRSVVSISPISSSQQEVKVACGTASALHSLCPTRSRSVNDRTWLPGQSFRSADSPCGKVPVADMNTDAVTLTTERDLALRIEEGKMSGSFCSFYRENRLSCLCH